MAARSTGLQATSYRVRGHWSVAASDEIGGEARHRQQAASERARRQTGLAIGQPDHHAVAR
jgi:hypothetical protein